MTKHLPADTLVMLHNKLASLAMLDPKRKSVIKEAANLYGVSVATLYRYLRKYNRLSTLARADYNHPRLVKYEGNETILRAYSSLKASYHE